MKQKPGWGDAMKEVFFDLAANFGTLQSRIDPDILNDWRDRQQGNAGVARQFAEWAEEFEARWLSLPEDDPDLENYYEVIDDFFADKLAADMAARSGKDVPGLKQMISAAVYLPLDKTGKQATADGHAAAMREVEDRLAGAIRDAEQRSLYASMNQGTSAQVAAQDKVNTLKAAFAIATGTAVGAMHFETQLKQAMERLAKPVTSSAPAAKTPLDPAVRVRPVHPFIPGVEWETWHISQNLTDRWGDLNNGGDVKDGQLTALENDPALLNRLRKQMWDEICFIVRKDGEYGILYEVEYSSIESDGEDAKNDDDTEFLDGLLPHQDMVEGLKKGMEALAGQFPGALFAVPEECNIVNGRPAAWAYVKDGLLNAEQREALGNALLNINRQTMGESLSSPGMGG